MSVKDRKKWETILTKWTPFFIIACGLIGIVLGSFLAYFFQGEFPYDVFAGGLVATIILTIIQVIKQKRKKDNLPEADERVIHNVFRFFCICFTSFLSYFIYSFSRFHTFRKRVDFHSLPMDLFLFIHLDFRDRCYSH
ncbi:hypothetical protein [Caldifermentibacillus hisashii]|uniref:hypothetical protein n=1 Tax=Caldifermentibacillus hisashii TaxID=996558 RepID=UPI003365C5A4